MLDVTLIDGYSAALAGMPERVRDALSARANILAAALQAKIQQKLSGTVLNQKSGALARSIVATVDESSANVAVTIATSADIKYAAIHEYGGMVPPHEIVPDKAKALAFVVGGKQVFAARVWHDDLRTGDNGNRAVAENNSTPSPPPPPRSAPL
jgi:phage gpG-like protein